MIQIERADLEQFRSIIARDLGLRFDDSKFDYLSDVLRQRVAAVRAENAGFYLEQLASSADTAAELELLAQELTVSETFFFRNAANFKAFAEFVLPERVRQKRKERQLRILSAGCASGEEPYTIAMVCRDAASDFAAWDISIEAFDINPAMIAKAARGRYSAWALRATPEREKARYFTSTRNEFVLDPAICKMVKFHVRNLADPDPAFWQFAKYDVVFCRNVIMYFTHELMCDVAARIHHALTPGGFLFLGHAETLRGISQDYHLCHTHDTFYYQKRDTTMGAGSEFTSSTDQVEPAIDALPELVDMTAPWVDIIQQSADRIASLARDRALSDTESRARKHVEPAANTTPLDLAPVFEAMQQERFADALALLQTLPHDLHNDRDVLLVHALLLTNTGHLELAEQTCARLLARDELSAGAHYVMALCREHVGDAAGAVEHDQTASYLDPEFAMPHLHYGLLARRAGDVLSARRELTQALDLLGREDAARILLFGGGFSRAALLQLCRMELSASGGKP